MLYRDFVSAIFSAQRLQSPSSLLIRNPGVSILRPLTWLWLVSRTRASPQTQIAGCRRRDTFYQRASQQSKDFMRFHRGPTFCWSKSKETVPTRCNCVLSCRERRYLSALAIPLPDSVPTSSVSL